MCSSLGSLESSNIMQILPGYFLTMKSTKSTFQLWVASLLFKGFCAQLLSSSAATLPLLQILLEFPGINGGLNQTRVWSQLQVIGHHIYLILCLPTLYSLSQECHVQLATPQKMVVHPMWMHVTAVCHQHFWPTRLGTDMRTTCQVQDISETQWMKSHAMSGT